MQVKISGMSDQELERFFDCKPPADVEVVPEPMGLGCYEGNANQLLAARLDGVEFPDEQGGDVEAPTGHFRRVGRFVVRTDDRGFVSYEELDSIDAARLAFGDLEVEFLKWASGDDREAVRELLDRQARTLAGAAIRTGRL